MSYIRHRDSRLNLALVHEYVPEGDRKIRFLASGTGTSPEVIDIWDFESREKRDRALEKLDKITRCVDINTEDKPPRTGFV